MDIHSGMVVAEDAQRVLTCPVVGCLQLHELLDLWNCFFLLSANVEAGLKCVHQSVSFSALDVGIRTPELEHKSYVIATM